MLHTLVYTICTEYTLHCNTTMLPVGACSVACMSVALVQAARESA